MEKENIVIQVPTLLINQLDGKFKGKTTQVNKKHIKAKESILVLASLLSSKGYTNWLDGKHPRVSLRSGTLQITLGHYYSRVIEFLENESVIQVHHGYQAGQFCKHYWLTEKYLEGGMEEYVITDQFVKSRYLKMMNKRIKSGNED
jgi:hypothetical protein